jgi:CRP-like cAMP-binding protein
MLVAHSNNRILEALPETELRVVLPLLKKVVLKQHQILHDVRTTIDRVYFPFDAVVSLVVPLSSGETIESAMTGHDGLVGGTAILNGRLSVSRAVVQLPGGCLCCGIDAIRAVVDQCSRLHSLLSKHEQALFAQAQQSAACNISHTLESRFARWLLRARDLSGSDEIHLTQEYLAEMLGVRRTSVSLIAHTLQQAGLLRWQRGHVTIRDHNALQEISCECYQAVKLNYDAIRSDVNA